LYLNHRVGCVLWTEYVLPNSHVEALMLQSDAIRWWSLWEVTEVMRVGPSSWD